MLQKLLMLLLLRNYSVLCEAGKWVSGKIKNGGWFGDKLNNYQPLLSNGVNPFTGDSFEEIVGDLNNMANIYRYGHTYVLGVALVCVCLVCPWCVLGVSRLCIMRHLVCNPIVWHTYKAYLQHAMLTHSVDTLCICLHHCRVHYSLTILILLCREPQRRSPRTVPAGIPNPPGPFEAMREEGAGWRGVGVSGSLVSTSTHFHLVHYGHALSRIMTGQAWYGSIPMRLAIPAFWRKQRRRR
jgi:hypothetical protein